MELQIELEWPEDLPLPRETFSGDPRNSTIVSQSESVVIARRSRFTRTYATLTVMWVLTDAQYRAFKDFFADDLGNGTAQFKMDLLYPANSELKAWAVQFEEGYEASYEEGMWTIQSQLNLVGPFLL